MFLASARCFILFSFGSLLKLNSNLCFSVLFLILFAGQATKKTYVSYNNLRIWSAWKKKKRMLFVLWINDWKGKGALKEQKEKRGRAQAS